MEVGKGVELTRGGHIVVTCVPLIPGGHDVDLHDLLHELLHELLLGGLRGTPHSLQVWHRGLGHLAGQERWRDFNWRRNLQNIVYLSVYLRVGCLHIPTTKNVIG